MNAIIRNLRYATRLLRKNPGSSLVAVIAIALGIGLTASMYSILDGIFLRGLPFEASDRLMHLERNQLARDISSMEVTQHDFEDWRAQQSSFEGIAGFTGGTFNLSDDHLPERYDGIWISTNFLDLLRVKPILGRGFETADEAPGAASVILLGHHVWQKRYGGDPNVIGREVRNNSAPTTIIGVLPEGFRFPVQADLWMPLESETHDVQRGEGTTLEVFGRLRDGVTLEGAANEFATIAQRLAQQYPDTNEGVGSVVKPYIHEFIDEETRTLLRVMFAAVLLVLLIACFNVANLLIGRASKRRRELAIRSALGSGRWRVITLVLTESALIAVAGALLGIFLARFGLHAFDNHLAKIDPPFWFDFYLSGSTLLVVLLATVGCALVAGLAPALQASRQNVGHVLQDTSRGSSSLHLGRLSRVLVVVEVAISCALLVGAGLAVRSILAVNNYDLRFEPADVLTARLGLFEGDYPEDEDCVTFFDSLREKVAGEAGVVTAAIGTVVPTETRIGAGGTRFERPDETYENPRDMPFTRWTVISPGYWEALGVRPLAGRDFTAADRAGAPAVAIVNEDFARKEWPGENPIGQRVNIYTGDEEENPDAGWVEVVGLVPNLRFADFDNADDQQGIYVPLAQNPVRFAWVIAKTRTDPMQFTEPLRRTVRGLDPDLPLYYVRSMDQVVEEALFFPNLIGTLFSIFGVVAMILACVGLYGVMAFAVGQRVQEIGVRMALGARSGDVLGLVLKEGLTKVVIGLLLGLGLGAGLGVVLATSLFQIKAVDPVTFATISALLVAVSTFACLIPASRAAAVDPIQALHHE